MDISYKRQHNESFMVVDVKEAISSYEERMIEENDIAPLLKYSKININGSLQYHYNISRKENLEDFLESHDLTLDIFKRFILNLQLAYKEIGNYLIDERHIWLSFETLFLEKASDTFKMSLCYYPQDNGSVQEQFRGIMENIIRSFSSKDREFTKKLYGVFDLCLKEDYTLGELLEFLEPEDNDDEIEVEKINLREDTSYIKTEELQAEDYSLEQDFISDLSDYKESKKEGFFNRFLSGAKEILTKRIEFKDDFMADTEDFVIEPDIEIEEKTVLLSETKPVGRLVYDGQGQENDFLVTKDIFRIGKSKACDAVLSAPTISQNHAKIVREGDEYYLSDMNSTNSTFLNNEELVYRKPVKLHICDKIRFANVCYTFM